jgi:hypothetical protein
VGDYCGATVWCAAYSESGTSPFSCVIPSEAEGPRIFLDASRRTPNHESSATSPIRSPFPPSEGLEVRFLLQSQFLLSFRAAAAKNPVSVLPLSLLGRGSKVRVQLQRYSRAARFRLRQRVWGLRSARSDNSSSPTSLCPRQEDVKRRNFCSPRLVLHGPRWYKCPRPTRQILCRVSWHVKQMSDPMHLSCLIVSVKC